MALTQISDIIVPDVWLNYVTERTAERSELVTSGIIDNDAMFAAKADGEGQTIDMPFWQDLQGDDEVISDSVAAGTGKITASQDAAVIMNRVKAWKHNDLAGILAGSDPAGAAAALVGTYWARKLQASTLSLLKGVFAIASMATHILALHATSGGTSSANFLTGKTWIDACQLLGDRQDTLAAVIMHSAVEASLRKQDLIDFIPDSEGKPTIRVFQGKRVVVDDGMPIEVINTKNVYTTYIFGRGAIAMGFGTKKNNEAVEGGFGTWGAEFFREALSHNSGMVNRRRFILHPRGIKWLGGSMAGSSPTNTELESASNWLRVFESKNIPLVKVTHNIDA